MMDDTQMEQEHLVRNLVLSVCDLKQNGEAPLERLFSQSATIGTRLYLHGGCNSKRMLDDLYLLEMEQMKWSELPATGSKPTPRYGHTLATHNNHLICFGGLCGSGSPNTDSDLLSADSEKRGGEEERRRKKERRIEERNTSLATGGKFWNSLATGTCNVGIPAPQCGKFNVAVVRTWNILKFPRRERTQILIGILVPQERKIFFLLKATDADFRAAASQMREALEFLRREHEDSVSLALCRVRVPPDEEGSINATLDVLMDFIAHCGDS